MQQGEGQRHTFFVLPIFIVADHLSKQRRLLGAQLLRHGGGVAEGQVGAGRVKGKKVILFCVGEDSDFYTGTFGYSTTTERGTQTAMSRQSVSTVKRKQLYNEILEMRAGLDGSSLIQIHMLSSKMDKLSSVFSLPPTVQGFLPACRRTSASLRYQTPCARAYYSFHKLLVPNQIPQSLRSCFSSGRSRGIRVQPFINHSFSVPR